MNKMTIVLERSDTGVGKIGRFVTGYPYTHIAFSYDMEHFQSFSRRYHYDPFDSGFTVEKPSYYAYKNDIRMKSYTLEVSDETVKQIDAFTETVKDMPFDIFGMLYMPFGIYRKKENAYNCMTYIARVLEIAGINLINEPYYRNNIKDLENALMNAGYKEEYVIITHDTDEEYMKRFSVFQVLKSMVTILKKLSQKDK